MESTFRFVKYELFLEQGNVTFFYQLQTPDKTYHFTETLHFPPISTPIANPQLLTTILDNLLLVLGISYWKLTCAKKIELPDFLKLSQKQAEFWNTIYTKGLGEFFFRNKIDFRSLVNFPYFDSVIPDSDLGSSSAPRASEGLGSRLRDVPKIGTSLRENDNETIEQFNNTRSLVLFGGGKDSVVSVELLKKANKDFDLFMVGASQIQQQTAKLAEKEAIIFTRELDSQLFQLNKEKSFYNGHLPILAIWSFISLFAATLYDYQYVITSNEQSANYGNVTYLDMEINHQWDKSKEFEDMMREYIVKNITYDIEYFSLLRPFHEIKIVEMFSKFPKYFPYFSSCNRNFHIQNTKYKIPETSRWCGHCPKCLFVFTLLSAFVPKEKVLSIFGKNLFEDKTLLPLFKELLGIENFKPFECVGTPEEMQLALYKAHRKGEYSNTFLMDFFEKNILPTLQNEEKLEKNYLYTIQQNNIPKNFTGVINAF